MRVEFWRLGHTVLTGAVIAMVLVACDPGKAPGDSSTAGVPGDGKEVQGKSQEDRSAKVDPQILAEGKVGWRSCAKCHCATDPCIKEDEDWVVLNEKTTCIEAGKPAPRLRKSIMAYLRHPETLRPVFVDKDYKPGEDVKTGKVTVPEIGGSAYLKAERSSIKTGSPSMVRLYWGETKEEKSMAAPVGEYSVINYWFYRKGGKGGKDRWMITGTNVNGCTTLNVNPDDEELMDVDCEIYSAFKAERKDEMFSLSLSLQDLGGSRVTLSKNGNVVMPGYRILDGEGRTVAEGPFSVI